MYIDWFKAAPSTSEHFGQVPRHHQWFLETKMDCLLYHVVPLSTSEEHTTKQQWQWFCGDLGRAPSVDSLAARHCAMPSHLVSALHMMLVVTWPRPQSSTRAMDNHRFQEEQHLQMWHWCFSKGWELSRIVSGQLYQQFPELVDDNMGLYCPECVGVCICIYIYIYKKVVIMTDFGKPY